MRTKLLAICVAVVGLGSVAVPEAGAREITPTAPALAALPSTVRINAVEVNIGTGRRHRSYGRRSHRVRHVTYRHGRRIVTYSRAYY